MEREELLERVTAELGENQLTLSERTINEELDDALEDFGEDEETNSQLVTKIASRLKRMDGNLHAEVSKQVDAYKTSYRQKLKQKQQPPKPKQQEETEDDDFKRLKEEVAQLRAESETRRKSEAKNALLKEIKNSLEEKFQKTGIEVNQYFMKNALKKLDIPDEGAEREKLVAEAEKIYNGDMKEAGVEPHQTPRYSGGDGKGTTAASDFFVRKAKKEGWGK